MGSHRLVATEVAALRERQARLRAQLLRLQGHRANLDAELTRWNQRAEVLAEQDEAGARECRMRARRIDARLFAVEAQLDAQLRLAADLAGRREDLEQRLAGFQHRRSGTRRAGARTSAYAPVAWRDAADAIRRWH